MNIRQIESQPNAIDQTTHRNQLNYLKKKNEKKRMTINNQAINDNKFYDFGVS